MELTIIAFCILSLILGIVYYKERRGADITFFNMNAALEYYHGCKEDLESQVESLNATIKQMMDEHKRLQWELDNNEALHSDYVDDIKGERDEYSVVVHDLMNSYSKFVQQFPETTLKHRGEWFTRSHPFTTIYMDEHGTMKSSRRGRVSLCPDIDCMTWEDDVKRGMLLPKLV